MKRQKAISTLMVIGFLTCVCFAFADESGFVTTDEEIQYFAEDDSYAVDSWVQDADSNWYHYDENGVMQTGWYQDRDGSYYWLGEDGKMVHDVTCNILGLNYSFSSTGALVGTWQEDIEGRWYLESDKISYPVDTWRMIDSAWYHFDENGYMQTGWFSSLDDDVIVDIDVIDTDFIFYFLKDSGEMACNEVLALDEEYLYAFDENGVFTGKTLPKTEAEQELEQLASQIVDQLVTENMTKREKATVIYQWIQSHIGYISTSDKSDWVAEAIRGLKTRRGDCFTYYAVSRAMLDAADIENLPVYPKEGYHVHYWNIINVEDGWYHFDTTPRVSGSTFCIVTNAQYDALSGARYSTRYLENGFTYPEMATK